MLPALNREFRFISPAIVNPALVDVEVPVDLVMRRGLMNIAKIMQNLANNIFFGKEFHMVPLNDFLSANIVNVTRFLSEINVSFMPSCSSLLLISSRRRNIRLRRKSKKSG